MRRSFFILISGIWILTSGFSPAIVDTNDNGLSDLWEQAHNNLSLFPSNFDPNADPDSDGWTNAQEATAGTDPFDANAPAGFLRPTITHIPVVYLPPEEEGGPPVISTPEAVTLTWPTRVGKQYTLLFSPDLTSGTWLPLGYTRIGDGTEMGNGIPLTQPDGSTPPSIFWRVKINDIDTDGDNLTAAEEHDLGTNPDNADTDGDGIPDDIEITNGTNPKLKDTDDDHFDDGDDAEPNDSEINWKRTPEARYVWLEQVTAANDVGWAIAVNKHGQILFEPLVNSSGNLTLEHVLWDSTTTLSESITTKWKTIALQGSTRGITPKVRKFIGLNDQGTIIGISELTVELASTGNEYPVDNQAGMLWKPSTTAPGTYSAPEYFMPAEAWATDNRQFGITEIGGISEDGTINCLSYLRDGATTIYNWDTYDSAGQTYETGTLSQLTAQENGIPGAIIDLNRSLFVHRGENNTSTNAEALYYWDGQQRTSVTGIMLNESPALLKTALSALPSTQNGNSNRVWLSATGHQSEIRIEKRDPTNGRWHTPPSMGEGAIRMNARGEAITAGDGNYPAEGSVAPKLWRNGKYISLNDVASKPESVKINKAIDIASNGIILVEATENGVAKTGLLIPIQLKRDEEGLPTTWEPIGGRMGKALPGQKINIKLGFENLPPGLIPSNYSWTISGVNFSDYFATDRSARKKELSETEKSGQEIGFYWSDPGIQTVTVDFIINGKPGSISNSIAVISPKSTMSAGIGKISFHTSSVELTGISAGILFQGKVDSTLDEFGGEGKWHFLQTLNNKEKVIKSDDTFGIGNHYGEWVVDSTCPYKPSVSTGFAFAVGDSPISNLDSLNNNYKRWVCRDDFKMYLMFNPPGINSKWVPLKRIDWNWEWQATKSGGVWSLDSGEEANVLNDGSGVSDSNHPEWTGNIRPFSFVP